MLLVASILPPDCNERDPLFPAPVKAIENASRESVVVIVEMVATRGAYDFRLSRNQRAGTVVFRGAVEALNHRRIDWRERWHRR